MNEHYAQNRNKFSSSMNKNRNSSKKQAKSYHDQLNFSNTLVKGSKKFKIFKFWTNTKLMNYDYYDLAPDESKQEEIVEEVDNVLKMKKKMAEEIKNDRQNASCSDQRNSVTSMDQNNKNKSYIYNHTDDMNDEDENGRNLYDLEDMDNMTAPNPSAMPTNFEMETTDDHFAPRKIFYGHESSFETDSYYNNLLITKQYLKEKLEKLKAEAAAKEKHSSKNLSKIIEDPDEDEKSSYLSPRSDMFDNDSFDSSSFDSDDDGLGHGHGFTGKKTINQQIKQFRASHSSKKGRRDRNLPWPESLSWHYNTLVNKSYCEEVLVRSDVMSSSDVTSMHSSATRVTGGRELLRGGSGYSVPHM